MEDKVVKVDVAFLQALLNYLKTRPYEEVHIFVDALTGKNTPQQSTPPTADQQTNG